MRSLTTLDGRDLTTLRCPRCGQTPNGATFGWKVVRGGVVLGMLAAAPASELVGLYPSGSVVIVQAWVRREDVREVIGTQLVQRAAAAATTRRVSCLVAHGTMGVPDCRHLPGPFLGRLGFVESIPGIQWRLDLNRTVTITDALRSMASGLALLARPGRRPASAGARHGSAGARHSPF